MNARLLADGARVAGAVLVLSAGLLMHATPSHGDDGAPAQSPGGGRAGEATEDDPGLARLQVVESLGIAAVMGVVTRVPAESPGGGAYTETQITPVKALGRAAGAYPGPLGEAFLGTSTELYQNPSMVVAQQPPGLFPAEAQVEGGQHGSQGTVGLIRAAAASRSEVEAEVVMGASPAGAPIVVEGGVSRSRSRVEPDGTVITEVETTFGRALVAEVLEMVGGASRALARTPAGGTPTLALETTMGEITLNGVGGRLSSDGLVIADQQLASPTEIAAFNAGLAQLDQAGITVEAAPARRTEEPGSGRISGAAGLFRYQLPSNPIPNSIGNDEAFLLAQVSAAAVAMPRPDDEVAPPSLDLPGVGTDPQVPSSQEASASAPGEGDPPAIRPPVATGTTGGTSDAAGAGFSPTRPHSPAVAAGRAEIAPPAGTVEAGSATGGEGAAGSSLDGRRLALPASAERSLVASVTGFYAVLVFLGAAAVLILLGLHRARAT